VAFNRRDFLALAGSVGAWSILTPGLDRVLRGEDDEERDESDEFAASVQRDLSQLPTIEERDRRK